MHRNIDMTNCIVTLNRVQGSNSGSNTIIGLIYNFKITNLQLNYSTLSFLLKPIGFLLAVEESQKGELFRTLTEYIIASGKLALPMKLQNHLVNPSTAVSQS